MNGWILRPYPHEINRMTQFLADGFIAIGWPGIGDIYSCERNTVYEKVFALYISEYSDSFCRESSNTIWKFIENMQIGDVVLVVPFKEDSLEIAVGIIDSSYFFDPRYDETCSRIDTGYNGFSHRRKVVWLEKRLPRSLLSEAVKRDFTKQTITRLNLEGYNRLIEMLASRGYTNNERWEMSQHRKQLIETSIKMVLDVMQQKTPDLADIFEQIAQDVFQIFNESESLHFDLLTSKLNHLAMTQAADMIPVENNGNCQPLCLPMAFKKWDEEGGFCQVAKETMTYWLSCLEENSRTLFLTSAWDEVDFIEHYKAQFDAYAKKHQLVVVLVNMNGFSMTYLSE
jgi:predicted Mrr-cat superfamily restriction endonuclease